MIKELFLAAALFFTPVVADAANWVELGELEGGTVVFVDTDPQSFTYIDWKDEAKIWFKHVENENKHTLFRFAVDFENQKIAIDSCTIYENGKVIDDYQAPYYIWDNCRPGTWGETIYQEALSLKEMYVN